MKDFTDKARDLIYVIKYYSIYDSHTNTNYEMKVSILNKKSQRPDFYLIKEQYWHGSTIYKVLKYLLLGDNSSLDVIW